MNTFKKFSITCFIAVALVTVANPAFAQADDEDLKFAAIEALITAPPERAMPIVQRVLASDASDELKSRALFVLSQMDTPEAQTLLIESARSSSGELQAEAIRMIGIGGNDDALAELNAPDRRRRGRGVPDCSQCPGPGGLRGSRRDARRDGRHRQATRTA
jgi:hypothetical protein